MRVLTDFHHSDLYWSLHLLFKQRLMADLFIPYGIEWFDQGYHRLYPDNRREDPYRYISKYYLFDRIINRDPIAHTANCTLTALGDKDYPQLQVLTLEEAKNIKFDIIVCSCNKNERPFYNFMKEYQPQAKLIRQNGNQADVIDTDIIKNAMFSDKGSFEANPVENKILYHQEFDLDVFNYVEPYNFNKITCVMNGIDYYEAGGVHYGKIWDSFKDAMPDFEFKSYGVACSDGYLKVKKDYVKAMQDASFIWHYKILDGYGHSFHNAYALGRPVITKEEFYKGKIGEVLLVDEETCLFMRDDINYNVNKIRAFSDEVQINTLSINAYQKFKQVVNFDKEFEEIKNFIEELI